MKITKILSLLLCFTFLLHLTSPLVHAAQNDAIVVGNIASNETHGVCIYENESYRYCVILDIPSSNGCFSIIYSDNPDYAFEYYFTVETESPDLNSSTFWHGTISGCFANSSKWQSIHLPTAAAVSNLSPRQATQVSDSIRDEYVGLLEDELEVSEHTGMVMYTGYKGSLIFHVYEDLTFVIFERQLWLTSTLLSVATIVASFFVPVAVSAILSVFAIAYSLTVPAGTEIGTHTVGAKFTRYVKRNSSSTWLNDTYYTISFDGYYISSLENLCDLDLNSRSDKYSHSASYFNDLHTQLEDGYTYYLTP